MWLTMTKWQKFAACSPAMKRLLLREVLIAPAIWLRSMRYWFGAPQADIGRTKYVIQPALASSVRIFINEWSGYPSIREKTVLNRSYSCGFGYWQKAIDFIKKSLQDQGLRVSVTVDLAGGCPASQQAAWALDGAQVIERENRGFDIGGLFLWLQGLPAEAGLLIIGNSSVPAGAHERIPEMVHQLREDPTLGVVGYTACARAYSSVVPGNLIPHVQSYLLVVREAEFRRLFADYLERADVLGIFPTHADAKRVGEIEISKRYLDQGYALGFFKAGQFKKMTVLHGACASGMSLADPRGEAMS
jgi:hypothetical protein